MMKLPKTMKNIKLAETLAIIELGGGAYSKSIALTASQPFVVFVFCLLAVCAVLTIAPNCQTCCVSQTESVLRGCKTYNGFTTDFAMQNNIEKWAKATV